MPLSISEPTEEQKEITRSFMEKLEQFKKERKEGVATLSFSELKQNMAPEEEGFMENVLSIDPAAYGVASEFLGLDADPHNLIPIQGQKYTWENEEKEIAAQYLPRNVYEAYKEMNEALKKDTGKGLLVKSGYRSPAYQFLTFLYWLQKYDFDIAATLAHSTPPGYSEHGYPPRQAIDFITEDGIIWGDKICFNETKEYAWLLENADKFDFYLSYPENNTKGMIFEPWHWHYKPKT